MNIDSRLPSREQWIEFLHELCHLLRHAGNQTIMPEQFTQAQEAEADAFAMYAAMPISMIKTMTLPEHYQMTRIRVFRIKARRGLEYLKVRFSFSS
ncbi:ImmA/IrrE family metallo-endopeptidase [Paenibacillus alvei]|nr:ImmA/IrrE family metallo-endopeptidase [Paenibacillus alvei]